MVYFFLGVGFDFYVLNNVYSCKRLKTHIDLPRPKSKRGTKSLQK